MSGLPATSYESFAADVLDASHRQPVLVDLWADWCSPCLVIAPILEDIADEYADVISIVKLEVDADENMRIAGQYQVRGFPTVILFQGGQETARFHGAQSYQYIERFILEHTGLT